MLAAGVALGGHLVAPARDVARHDRRELPREVVVRVFEFGRLVRQDQYLPCLPVSVLVDEGIPAHYGANSGWIIQGFHEPDIAPTRLPENREDSADTEIGTGSSRHSSQEGRGGITIFYEHLGRDNSELSGLIVIVTDDLLGGGIGDGLHKAVPSTSQLKDLRSGTNGIGIEGLRAFCNAHTEEYCTLDALCL